MQRTGEGLLAAHLIDQLDLRGGQIDIAGHQIHVLHPSVNQHVVDRHPRLHQQVVNRVVQLVVRYAQPGGQRALRIQVYQQHPAAVFGQRGAQVDRRRGLADAAFLVAHRDDLGRAVRRARLGVGNRPRWPSGQADFGAAVGVVSHDRRGSAQTDPACAAFRKWRTSQESLTGIRARAGRPATT